MTETIQHIMTSLRESYQSLSSPRYFFVQDVVTRRPYAELELELRTAFDVEDNTDLNDDVSFVLGLRNDRGEWVLYLSMVGPFGALLRVRDHRPPEPVSANTVDISPDERRLLDVIHKHAIEMLDQPTLELPVQMNLNNTLPGRARLFQALFSDTDILPWRGE